MPRIVVIPSPDFKLDYVRTVGEAVERHLDIIIAIDDEWRDLIAHGDDMDLMLRLKTYIIDAISGCKTGVGNVCSAIILHRHDIELLWLDDDGSPRTLSVKEMVRRKELLYAYPVELPENAKLLRLQTYKPFEHVQFFEEQFENLGLEFYEMLYGTRDVERWRRLAGATALPKIAESVARATRRFVLELCIFDEYNVCPGILLNQIEDRVDVKILKITSKPDYVARIDLAGLLASSR
jgi:hypothetical protein